VVRRPAASRCHREQRARDNVVMAIAGIDFVSTVDEIADDDLMGFFVGWKQRPSRCLRLAVLRASDRAVIARDVETQAVVGFITAISDGLIAAYITLLEVRPNINGVGSAPSCCAGCSTRSNRCT